MDQHWPYGHPLGSQDCLEISHLGMVWTNSNVLHFQSSILLVGSGSNIAKLTSWIAFFCWHYDVFSCFLMFSHVFSCFLMVLDPFHHHFGWQKVWPIPPPLPGGFTAARQPGTVCSARWPISCAAMPTNIRAIASDAANICWTTRRRSHWISMGFLIWKLRKLRKPEWWVF